VQQGRVEPLLLLGAERRQSLDDVFGQQFHKLVMRLVIQRCEHAIFDLTRAAINTAVHPIFRIGPAAVAHTAATGKALARVALADRAEVVFVLSRHWNFIGL
jgi:hypothetical protein